MVFGSKISSNEDELDFELLKNEINYIKNTSWWMLYKLSYKKNTEINITKSYFQRCKYR